MTAKPLLNARTEQQLQTVIDQAPQALILAGSAGMGKATIARWLASQWHIDAQSLFIIEPIDGKAIGIEAIRSLEHLTSLKMPTTASVKRVIIIDDAHTMTIEAQNALLKTLEEPPQGTILILTCSQQDALLPTIHSRSQTIEITRPASKDLLALLAERGSTPTESAGIMALSGGLPGLACALVDDNQDHPLVQAAKTARQLLQQSSFEKLCQVETLAKDKQASRNVVMLLSQMAHAAVLTGKSTSRWQRVMQAAYGAETALQAGAQPKLVLSNLMLNL